MTREELAQDLAYVRTLAEEGRHAPLLGGAFLLFWGLLNPAAYLVHYGLITDALPGGAEGWGFAALWTAYGIIAGISITILLSRWRDKPGQSSLGVRAERAIWSGVGWAIGVIALGCIGRMFIENDHLAPNGILAPALALFGTALTTTALMAREKWLLSFALVSYAAAALVGIFANQPWAYLAAAAANAFVLAIPGIILLRREPATIV